MEEQLNREDERQLRERVLDDREQRLLEILRREFRGLEAVQDIGLPQTVVARALFGIPTLNQKEFEVWLSFVRDAFLAAGLAPLFRVSAFKTDAGANQDDVRTVRAYPAWLTNTAWSALRRSMAADTAVFTRTMALRSGDVLGLLRSVRSFYERRSVTLQTQLRKDLIRTVISDFSDLRHYVSALDLIFTKLAALGDFVPDHVRRFHLLEGLTDEYHSIISSILAYEAPGGGQADYAKAVDLLTSFEDNFAARRRKRAQDTTMLARSRHVSHQLGSKGDAPKRTGGSGDAHSRPGTPEPCLYFLKHGRCRRGNRCKFHHVVHPANAGDRSGRSRKVRWP